jgi:starch phosphorylase
LEPAEPATSLARLAANHRWTWRASARRVLDRIPTAEYGVHPVVAVRRLSETDLNALMSDPAWRDDLKAETESLDRLLNEPVQPEVAYFSPEFAVTELIRQYSGGLGVLAGDHLKAASDIGLPLVGVSLFYPRGFFRQSIKGGGQSELTERHDPVEFGCVDTGVVVTVPLARGDVLVKVWRLDVGRSPLVLLDTELPENSPEDAAICDRLYGAERSHRLRQELVLGVGGMRAIAALGWSPRAVHLNEGHAGFVVLSLIEDLIESTGASLPEATSRVAERIVFTTHTPVPAGIELFDRELIEPHLALWARKWEVATDELLELGADPASGTDVFNMTALCLRHSTSANGVSQLHGETSRSLFSAIAGGDRIGSVTNGVHARSWVHPDLQRLFDNRLGPSWADGDPQAWSRAGEIDAAAIVRARTAGTEHLAALIEQRTDHSLDPDALSVGFARRFAPYKRATLLLRHEERLLDLLHDADRPVQLIFAGKAHPADEIGKALLAELVEFSRRGDVSGRLLFIPGYDMEVARAMCSGADIWLNTPIRPREASGTSGQKAALNGGLNCSILDGWWAEMYDGRNGWAIPASDKGDPDRRDDEEAAAALDLLGEIAAQYVESYDSEFIERIRHNWMDLGPRITAARMVGEYRDRIYGPALSRV